MLNLILAVCLPIIVEGGDLRSSVADAVAVHRAEKVCREKYHGCLVRMIRKGPQRCWAICKKD